MQALVKKKKAHCTGDCASAPSTIEIIQCDYYDTSVTQTIVGLTLSVTLRYHCSSGSQNTALRYISRKDILQITERFLVDFQSKAAVSY